MQVLLREAMGIAQGDEALFSDYADGGEMWTGQGTASGASGWSLTRPSAPRQWCMSRCRCWDTDCKANARMEVVAENIATDGFDIVFRTWGDSRIARVRVSWMAIGAAHHEDDWRDIE